MAEKQRGGGIVELNGDLRESASNSNLPGIVETDPRKDIINKEELHGKYTFWLVLSTVTISVGAQGALGFNAGVMTVVSPFVLEFLNRTNQEKWNGNASELAMAWIYSCTVTVYFVGGSIGTFVGGRLSDTLGRKKSLAMSAFLLPAGGALMGFCQLADIYGLLFLGRFVAGIYSGIAFMVIPIYLVEISPINLRGATGVFSILMAVAGQLFSHVVGFYGFYDQQSWPILLSLIAAMGLIIMIIFPFCPESPRWLYLHQRRYKDAQKALRQLRGPFADITAEIEEMKLEAERDTESGTRSIDIIKLQNPEWKLPLLLCLVIAIAYQTSGYAALFYYTTEILSTAGLDQSEIALATVGYSFLTMVSTGVGVIMVDKVGRRPLLLYPFIVVLFLLIGLTVSINMQNRLDWMKWLTVVIVYFFAAIYGTGPVSVKNLVAAELWLQSSRPAAMTISFQAHWWATAVVSITFPLLNEEIGGYTFLVYFFILLVCTVILYRYLPETKNKTFQEINAHMLRRKFKRRRSAQPDFESEFVL